MKTPTKPKKDPIVKVCNRCGKSGPHHWQNTLQTYRSYCHSCHNKYNRRYHKTSKFKESKQLYEKKIQQIKRQIKSELVALLGGKCQMCGLKDECHAIYDFHHRDPSAKEFQISGIKKISKRVLKEIEKCDLLCSNCHRKVHSVDL